MNNPQALICSFEGGGVALKLGRDGVKWARSPWSPGTGRLECSNLGSPVNTPWREEVFPTEGTALHGSVPSDNSTEVVSTVDPQVGAGG